MCKNSLINGVYKFIFSTTVVSAYIKPLKVVEKRK
jgi:hypothetical protein